MFKDLKPNYPVYLFDKTAVTAIEGKVISVSNPRFPSPPPSIPTTPPQSYAQVIDVTIEHDGRQTTYTIPELLEVTYTGSLVISTKRDTILSEVTSLKRQHEEELAKTDLRKQAIAKCAAILETYDPTLRERRETEARFANIEQGQSEMRQMLKSLIDKLS